VPRELAWLHERVLGRLARYWPASTGRLGLARLLPEERRDRIRLRRRAGNASGGHWNAAELLARITAQELIGGVGPEGGEAGGEVIATGTPEEVAEVEESATGRYLREVLPKKAPRKAAKAAA
jgi:hypothetical protein